MARKLSYSMGLDGQVGSYLKYLGTMERPENYINSYSIERPGDGVTWLTVKVWIDDDQFEQVEGRGE